MKLIINQQILIYGMLVIGVLGILSQVILSTLYGKLIKKTENMANARNNWLKQIKLKYENSYKVNGAVNNVPAFIERYIHKYHFLGLSLNHLKIIPRQLTFLCVLLGGSGAVICTRYQIGQATDYIYTGAAISLCMLLFAAAFDMNYKQQMVRVNIEDYLENSLAVRLAGEHVHRRVPEVVPKENQDDVKTASSSDQVRNHKKADLEIDHARKSLDQIAASKSEDVRPDERGSVKITQQEGEIIRDVLQEFLT